MYKNLNKLILFFLILFLGCKTNNDILSCEEQTQMFNTIIKMEKDSSFGMIVAAKYGSYFLLNDQFNDTIYLDNNTISLIDKSINFKAIQKQYRKTLNKNKRLVSDSFNLIHLIEYSNKTPEFLSFSKPFKYLKYYFVNFRYYSWSSGYDSILILEKSGSGQFKIIYRRVYNVA